MTIFTIGYEGRSLEEVVADLRAQHITLLADVREMPMSRKRGFSKAAFAEALRAAGIDYRHIRALGCPKPIRDTYRADRDWARYTRAFRQHLAQQQPAVDELATVASTQPTALLCYEADFSRCHRTYVAEAMAEQSGATVTHITAAGLVEEAMTT